MSVDPLPEEPAPDAEPPFLSIYIDSTQKLIDRLTEALDLLRQDPTDEEALEVLHRGFHSLHGNSCFIHGSPITPFTRAGEHALKAARAGRLDPRQLIGPLAAALDLCEERLEEYRRHGSAGSPKIREQELAALLNRLSGSGTTPGGGAGGRASGARHTYGGRDVTRILDVLSEHEGSGRSDGSVPSEESLAKVLAELRQLADSIGDQDFVELLDRPNIGPGLIFRFLARRIEPKT
jgi:chemotaxis protein histidine kinase CheA